MCVSLKILEKLIHALVEPIIDPLLPQEQVGLRHGRKAVNQVFSLMQDIENIFLSQKAGVVFVDLTAAYDIL